MDNNQNPNQNAQRKFETAMIDYCLDEGYHQLAQQMIEIFNVNVPQGQQGAFHRRYIDNEAIGAAAVAVEEQVINDNNVFGAEVEQEDGNVVGAEVEQEDGNVVGAEVEQEEDWAAALDHLDLPVNLLDANFAAVQQAAGVNLPQLPPFRQPPRTPDQV